MKKSRRFDGQPIRQHQKTTPPTQPDLAIEHDRREARRDLCERACGGIPDNVLKVCGVVNGLIASHLLGLVGTAVLHLNNNAICYSAQDHTKIADVIDAARKRMEEEKL